MSETQAQYVKPRLSGVLGENEPRKWAILTDGDRIFDRREMTYSQLCEARRTAANRWYGKRNWEFEPAKAEGRDISNLEWAFEQIEKLRSGPDFWIAAERLAEFSRKQARQIAELEMELQNALMEAKERYKEIHKSYYPNFPDAG